MAKISMLGGTTSYRAHLFIQDSSQTDGRGLTGLVFNSAGLVASYARPGAARVAITLATQTVTGAYSSGGFCEVDATNMPGVYRLDIPDAAMAAGIRNVLVMLKGATNMAPCLAEFELTAVDNQNATTFGLTNLDAAITSRASSSALATVQADTDDIQTRLPAALVGGRVDASVGAMAANVLTAAATAADTGAEIAAAVRTELTTELGRVDVAVSTRLATAGYTAPDNASLTTLTTRLSSARATLLDNLTNLDALVSSRLAAAGYTAPDNVTISAIAAAVDTEVAAILSAVDTEVAAIKAKTDNLPASPAAVGSAMTLDLTQTVTDVGGAANTLGGILSLIRAYVNGKLTIVSGVLKVFGQNGTTQIGVDRTITGSVPADTTRQ